jgi:predicted glutamine amidotransferase
MCELFAMSSDQPTDVDDYLTMLMPRGGKIGPHADGWGIAYYEGSASQVFKEATPAASSRYLRILSRAGFKSTSVIAHIRKANPSYCGRGTANTHPFEREWNGYSWVFAHNGKLPGFSHLSGYPDSRFKPLGHTDSELTFCYLLEAMARNINSDEKILPATVVSVLKPVVEKLTRFGEFNFLLSNGEYLFVYAHTKLHILEQQNDSHEHKNVNVLLATEPLTKDNWRAIPAGIMNVYRGGKEVVSVRAGNERK